MRIKRMNVDFGNSVAASIIDGSKGVVSLPTTYDEISETQAKVHFPAAIDAPDLKDNLLIEYNGKHYLVGDSAQRRQGNDIHVNDVHSKIDSHVPTLMFLSILAVYEAMNNDDFAAENAVSIDIDYFSTMIPVFELLEHGKKFSEKFEEMASRFRGNHTFKVSTNGCEKEINVHVKEAKCYAESLVARFALLYDFNLQPSPVAKYFADDYAINIDVGGLTVDMVRMGPGLSNPKTRADFEPITQHKYLKMINDLVKDGRLQKYFKTGKELDNFIVEHYKEDQYIWKGAKAGGIVEEDFTETIDQALREYTYKLMDLIATSYEHLGEGKFYKYNFFGGVAPILKKYIREYVCENFSEEIYEEYYHIEPDETARWLNLYGLEIISRQNTMVNKQQ